MEGLETRSIPSDRRNAWPNTETVFKICDKCSPPPQATQCSSPVYCQASQALWQFLTTDICFSRCHCRQWGHRSQTATQAPCSRDKVETCRWEPVSCQAPGKVHVALQAPFRARNKMRGNDPALAVFISSFGEKPKEAEPAQAHCEERCVG